MLLCISHHCIPEVYMNQFWDSVYKHDTFYRFKLVKRKRFKLNLEVFRDIFKIYPRVQGQDFDALPTNEEIMSFLRDLGHTKEIYSLNDVVVDQMHQPWRTFAALINMSLSGKTTGLDKLHFIYQIDNKAYKSKKICTTPDSPNLSFTTSLLKTRHSPGETRSGCTPLRMTINTLRFISAKEETQIYCAILPESLTSPEMKETKAYNTYFVSTEEPTGNSKRVKRPAKKSSKAQGRGVVIRETPEIPVSKKKEKVDVTRGKGTELISQVALTEDAQFEEVRKKSMRDFHKTHPSGFGTVTKTAPSAAKIKPSVISEGTSVKPGVPDVIEEESSENKENESNSKHEKDENESDSISDQEENEKDDEDDEEEEEEEEVVKTPSNDSDDEDQANINNKAEGDEDEEM
ncbi:hypothetical protein Tco_1477970 [Tanacetum coccineum]